MKRLRAIVAAVVFVCASSAQSFTVTWCPGSYTNFVVVTSTNLAVPLLEWPIFLQTDNTNFTYQIYEVQKFFALYGTNGDGSSAWAVTNKDCECQ